MKQTKDESGLFPVSAEKDSIRKWDKIRLSYLTFSDMQKAHTSRLFIFAEEGQGYKNALSLQHNHARFRNRIKLLPPREREQGFKAELKLKQKERRDLIKALKYSGRYGSVSLDLIIRCRKAGIRVKRYNNRLTLSIAELDKRLRHRISVQK